MNKEDEAAMPPKRHYVPVLPQPRPDTLESAKRATLRAIRNKRIARKLDDVLGPVDGEDG